MEETNNPNPNPNPNPNQPYLLVCTSVLLYSYKVQNTVYLLHLLVYLRTYYVTLWQYVGTRYYSCTPTTYTPQYAVHSTPVHSTQYTQYTVQNV